VVDLKPHPDPHVEIVVGDVGDPEVLEASFAGGIDSVVHLAAVTSVLRSLEQPDLTFATNVGGTHALLEAARTAGAGSLVFASTNAVTGPMDAPAIVESAVLKPLTPYGATKAAAEMLMSAYTASYGVRCVCLRLTNVYGPGMQAKDSIVARLMRAIRLERTFEIYGDGRQVRDYVHVGDVIAAVRLGLDREDWSGPVVIGSGKSLSVLEVLDAVREVTGASLSVQHGPARPGEMPAVIVDPSRARAAGWSPRYGFVDGVRGVWEEWSVADREAIAAGAPAAPVTAGGGR
jgi:UDP-glucose 4-epimerase